MGLSLLWIQNHPTYVYGYFHCGMNVRRRGRVHMKVTAMTSPWWGVHVGARGRKGCGI
jgi:hypothetical protein